MSVYLYKKWIKTNGGPWTQPTNYTLEELGTIVNPYSKLLYSLPGITAQQVQYWESSNVFTRKYTFDTVEHALAFYRLSNDMSVPEIKAMRDLAAKYADLAGTAYRHEWKLTRDREVPLR